MDAPPSAERNDARSSLLQLNLRIQFNFQSAHAGAYNHKSRTIIWRSRFELFQVLLHRYIDLISSQQQIVQQFQSYRFRKSILKFCW